MNPQLVSHKTDLSTKLQILEANLNKSEAAHLDLMNNNLNKYWDIIAIQKPHHTYYKAIRTPNSFHQVYSGRKLQRRKRARSTL
jgi:hypothetical protein